MGHAQRASTQIAVGYLRAFLTVLVVAHHAVLAYHPFAPPPAASLATHPRMWGAFPVVDPQRSNVVALFVGFNDVFFMALLFLLSGLFVWKSLERKGGVGFLRDRGVRLGLPFLLAATLLAPLAYYPAYLQGGGATGVANFCREWIALGTWPAGPAWFLWVLLAFDAVVAGAFALAPRAGERLGRLVATAAARPAAFFGLLFVASAAAYLPLVHAFGPFHWFAFGPFAVQASRVLHYFVYFLAGLALGAGGLDQALLARDGRLARRWPAWTGAAVVIFLITIAVTFTALGPVGQAAPRLWNVGLGLCFALSCAASSAFFLALFGRFASAAKVLDSLRDNAYGIYLVHYIAVNWLQYALLPASMPALAKGIVVFAGALFLSWATAASLGRLRVISNVV